jgi:hypothetical protein
MARVEPPISQTNPPSTPTVEPLLVRVFDAVYHFLASLKLAVISLGLLAAVLAYATFFEKSHGTAAVQQVIYRSPLFALLLAFLGINILCAALIRFPWKRRQTGFVITHAGLLIVLAGSWLSLRYCDEGHVGMAEGDRSSQLVRIDDSALRVQRVDRQSGESATEYQLPFYPGSFAWEASAAEANADAVPDGPGQGVRTGAAIVGAVGAGFLIPFVILWALGKMPRLPKPAGWAVTGGLGLTTLVALGLATQGGGPRREVLTTPDEPFRLVVTDYVPAASFVKFAPKIDPKGKGLPMIRPSVIVKPPRADQEVDAFDQVDDGSGRVRWLQVRDADIGRATVDLGAMSRDLVPYLVTFQYADRGEMVEDFLALPEKPMERERIRIRYTDREGKPRLFEWPAETPADNTLTLPDSDLKITLQRPKNDALMSLLSEKASPAARGVLGRVVQTIQDELPGFLRADVQAGEAPARTILVTSNLPALPDLLDPETAPPVRISYYRPPELSSTAMRGRAGVIELMGTPEGKVYQRAFGREGLRGTPGEIAVGKRVPLVSGPNQPVQVALRVDDYLTSAVEGEAVDLVELPPGQMGNGIPACRVELTAGGETKELWLRRSERSDKPMMPAFRTVEIGGETFRLAFDYVRTPIPFSLQLADFEVGFDPGTEMASSYTSQVLLTDEQKNVAEKPVTITMNEPLTWRGYTFYQSNYIPMMNPATGQKTGQFASVFQVRYDPVWGVTYIGCLLVVLGTFVQFYMRSGVFTAAGGKKKTTPAVPQPAEL